MQFITEEEVEKNLPMDKLIPALKEVFTDAGNKTAGFLPRARLIFNGNALNTMPAFISRYGIAGLKTYIGGKSGHRGAVLVFDINNYELMACIESNILGQRRTGALPAMLTREIHSGAESFLLVGSGFQAETQLTAMSTALDLNDIAVYSRTFDNTLEFADRMSKQHGIQATVLHDLIDIKKYEVISTITTASEPIFGRDNLGDIYHVNLAGSNIKPRREVKEDVLLEADTIIVEDYAESLLESVEISDIKDKNTVIELKDFMIGKRIAKRIDRSVFKTMGLGIEDLAAANIVLKSMGIM
ncbi:MAG: Rossmann-fold NAD(P)-binding domain-containing protein [Thermoplasmataceae archaeon]